MLMRLSQPDGFFVSLGDVKAHVIVDAADDDELIKGYIRAATRLAEDRTGRILLPTEFEYRIDRWCGSITIPAAPIRDVTEILYLDENGAEQTLAPADWYYVTTAEGATIRFTDAFSSPVLSNRPQAVRLRFSAGFDEPDTTGSGDDPYLRQDPMDRLIVMILVANWYQAREPVALGAVVSEIPFSANSLIEMRRIYR
ncbi:hypothetical protein FJ959_18230 [Mesorhizobium sp. B2-2-4]|uniref:head-tail connector protein n=1 Tax=unclassified Mesorhizobium TaxID=325217 RepID=UPI00112B2611|nr:MULTISPECIES: head-tail connector protein [unclassified Mesorhizobium]TPM55344.1 hypothetical protein FJ959_18230 [Mesorhizobium sp. B2-2-4]TPM66311.1 hypothetical protein FJ965_14190 [Mesorhizobium sp. B2-2-1]TPN60606.1 hypothetical protein FJ984_30590 [Mesorhizobium sp. B1-1-3]